MEPLFNQLKELPKRFNALPRATRLMVIGALVVAVVLAAAVGTLAKTGVDYQYAFTNLTTEDSTEAVAILKTSGIPFRLEAGGSALAVPADKVYEVRLLLATSGLPRNAGTGFEIFDKGDLGVSEFTQKINLRRAIEGELARTIGSLSEVRSAKVTVSLGEKGLYRDDDKRASATVVAVLKPGMTLGERELGGIRHLVASAVPGLDASGVTVIDGRGAVLADDSNGEGGENSFQKKLERELEQKAVDILSPVVGVGGVVAKIKADIDTSHVQSTAENVDPDNSAVKSTSDSTSTQSTQSNQPQGLSGAQANLPLQPNQQTQGNTAQSNANSNSSIKNYEVSKSTTTTVSKAPRLKKISAAILLDGVNGKPREAAEVEQFAKLVHSAIGMDDARGDQLQIASQPFGKSTDPAADYKAPADPPWWRVYIPHAIGLIAVMLVLGTVFLMRGKKPPAESPLTLRSGLTVAQLESGAMSATVIENGHGAQALNAVEKLAQDKATQAAVAQLGPRDRARALASGDPAKAAMLVRAWLSTDPVKAQGASDGRS